MTKAESEAARLERNAASLKWKAKNSKKVAAFNRRWLLKKKKEDGTITKEQRKELVEIEKLLAA
jgi:hypothetical protein